MLSDMTPFKIFGNVYFVGCKAYSSHIIDTGDGLIMIDNGYEENGPAVLESMEMLGLKPEDIKIILISHGHGDHFGATPQILARAPHAKTYIGEMDSRVPSLNFKPDVLMYDGDVIELGNTKIDVMWTPGHTMGVMSFFFDVTENGRTVRAGMFGGNGNKQVMREWLEPRGLYTTQREYFLRTIAKLRKVHVDLHLGNHCANNDTKGKYEQMATAKENPFIDPESWTHLLDVRERQIRKIIEEDL